MIVATGSRLGTLLDVASAWDLGLVPVLLSDSLAPESYRILAEHTGAAAVRATPAAARSWSAGPARPLPGRDQDAVLLDLRGDGGPRTTPDGPDVPAEEPTLVLATSGSTGLPKAVVHRRSSLLHNAAMHWSSVGEPRPGDRYLLSQSLFFSSAFVCGVLGVLARGMQLSLLEPPFAVTAWAEVAARREITHTALTPHLLMRLLTAGVELPGSLRQVTVGGDRLGRTAVGELRRSGVREIFTTYGLTEAGPRVATNRLGEDPTDWDTLGEPLPGVELRLADGDAGPGELLVRTPTAQAGCYREGSFAGWPAGTEVPTGDLGELTSTGRIRLVGRARRVASVAGEKIYLGLVERVLGEHPAVGAALVALDADGVLAASILPRSGAAVSPQDLRGWCRGRLRAVEIPRRFTAVDAGTRLSK